VSNIESINNGRRQLLQYSTTLAVGTVLTGCGGGKSDKSGNSSGSNATPPAATVLSNVTSTIIPSPDPTSTSTISQILTASGGAFSYSVPDIGELPNQIQLTDSDPLQAVLFFGNDGLPLKILDQLSGNVCVFAMHSDGLGVEGLVFDPTGKFVGGRGLVNNNGTWGTAAILGLLALPMSVTTAAGFSASVSLVSGASVYGPITPVNTNIAAILSGTIKSASASIFHRIFDVVIPTANAQSATNASAIKSGLAITTIGIALIAAGVSIGPAVAVVGAGVVLWNGIVVPGVNAVNEMLTGSDGSLAESFQSQMESSSSNLTTTVQNWFSNLEQQGAQALNNVGTAVAGIASSVEATVSGLIPDTTPSQLTMPVAPGPSSMPVPISGTINTSDGSSSFSVSGTVSQPSGAISLTGTDAAGGSLTMSGTLAANGAVNNANITGNGQGGAPSGTQPASLTPQQVMQWVGNRPLNSGSNSTATPAAVTGWNGLYLGNGGGNPERDYITGYRAIGRQTFSNGWMTWGGTLKFSNANTATLVGGDVNFWSCDQNDNCTMTNSPITSSGLSLNNGAWAMYWEANGPYGLIGGSSTRTAKGAG